MSNLSKKVLWGLTATFCIISSSVAQKPQEGYVRPANYSSPICGPVHSLQKSSSLLLAADPFQYQTPENNAGFVPARMVSLPPEIKLVGVLMLKNRPALAAVQFPGTGNRPGEIHYVQEGDDIEIPRYLLQNSKRRGTTQEETAEILFLKVQKITSQHVEVSSQSNLEDRHYLR
ncbi:MAG: hypothetical protein Q4C96_01945 [Planctomycetia bacterium]|nr:hypothetical protein [Planctomycetia bacterium]